MGERKLFRVGCPVIVQILPYLPDHFVLVKEPRKGNTYNLPGGGLDKVERDDPNGAFSCAIREVREESGLEVRLSGYLPGLDIVRDDSNIHLTFAAVAIGGALRKTREHPSVIVATLEDIQDLDNNDMLRSPRVIDNITRYIKEGVRPLEEIQWLESDPYPRPNEAL